MPVKRQTCNLVLIVKRYKTWRNKEKQCISLRFKICAALDTPTSLTVLGLSSLPFYYGWKTNFANMASLKSVVNP